MTWLFIEPSDVWFFRDGRPFSAGEGHTARTIFPPTPFTMQGALRSLILSHTTVDWVDFAYQRGEAAQKLGKQIGHPGKNGQEPNLGNFQIQGPFLSRWPENNRTEILSPLPVDTFFTINEHWQSLRPHQNVQTSGQKWTNWPSHLNRLHQPTDPHLSPPKDKIGLLDNGGRDAYVRGEEFLLWPGSVYESEPRLGIAIDYSVGHAQEQMLYQSEFIRMADSKVERYGLLVELGDKVELPVEKGILGLGGEARSAHFQLLSDKEAPVSLPRIHSSKQFKIVLHTPAWFRDGWQPQDGDWNALFMAPNSANIRCVAVALGKPQFIGGWDMARKGHRVMRNFIPVGSVFYFTANGEVELPQAFTETPPDCLDFARQGFGAYASAEWDWLS